MKIGAVLFDQSKSAAVVTLTEEDGERVLPIFIGIPEGMAIFREINRTPSQRPQLHDVFYTILHGLHTRIEKVVIDSMSDTTFFARLYLRQDEDTVVVDARPSDAMALAVRFQAPLYVAEAVLEAAGKRGDFAVSAAEAQAPRAPQSSAREEPSKEDVESWLENIRPEDFEDPK